MLCSFALGVLGRVAGGLVHKATELIGLDVFHDISGGAGLFDDRVAVADGLHSELRDAAFHLAVEVQRERNSHLAGLLVAGIALESSEAVSVDAVGDSEHLRQHLDELVGGKASEFVLGDVEAMHPVTRLLRGHEDGGEDVIAVLLRHGNGGRHELRLTFVGVDVRVGRGVSPDAGRNDFDLDGVGERDRERLDVAHSVLVSRYLLLHKPHHTR